MGAYDLMVFVTLLASDDFIKFTYNFVIRSSIYLVLRIYINPILQNYKYFIQKLFKFLS